MSNYIVGILHPQLALNAAESVANLVLPARKRCPHLGCALKWNKAEHSWDCPCHGSRFAVRCFSRFPLLPLSC